MRPGLAALTLASRLALARQMVSIGEQAESCAAAMPNRCVEMTEGRGSRRADLAGATRSFPSLGRRAFLVRLGTVTAGLAIWPSARDLRAAVREPIYQRIWDADQAGSGIPAIAVDEAGDPARGFVRVDQRGGRDPEHRLFAEVQIPAHKRRTYDLCKTLFDNYRLDQTKPEDNQPEEAREIIALLEAVADSPPMAAARAHLERQNAARYSSDAWQELIFELWFRQFDDGRNLDLSAFEHVVVGEQRGGEVNGHHFWYKYYLEDWVAFSGEDDIDYDGSRHDGPHRREGPLTRLGRDVPEVATLAYEWRAYDYETGQRRPLYEPIGGFWVGCSIEGLMALGTVRFFTRGRVQTTINGASYQIELYRSPEGRSLRTFFPRFRGRA
jgi:poly(U)-specific endoribonuclease